MASRCLPPASEARRQASPTPRAYAGVVTGSRRQEEGRQRAPVARQ
jgi:hypothetical protein